MKYNNIMTNKYELIFCETECLFRVKALKDFANIHKGDIGGFVKSEKNLSQVDNCWIYDNAKVLGNAEICDNAIVCNNAIVYGNAKVCGKAIVCGNTEVYGNAEVCGNAEVYSNADYIVFKNWWSSGRYFTWTRSNNMWKVGCFYGTGEELIIKAYKDSEFSGKEYKRIVNYVNSILTDNAND